MSFTRQPIFSNWQRLSGRCSMQAAFAARYEENWLDTNICPRQVGALAGHCVQPGRPSIALQACSGWEKVLLTQTLFTMKNARKQLGEIASTDASQFNPGPIVPDVFDQFPVMENEIFQRSPSPREPESPETESFRAWLKVHTPREKPSAELMERLRKITQEEEKS